MQVANVTTKAVGFVFLTLVFSLAFMRPHIRIAGMALQVTDLLFLLFAAVFIFWLIFNKIKPTLDGFTLLIAAYFTTLALSAAFSADVSFSLRKLAGEAYLLLLALMTREVMLRNDLLKPTAVLWIIAGTVASIVGVLTAAAFYLDKDSFLLTYFLHHYGSLTPGNYPRIHGTFIYPAMLCNYLTISLMLLFAAKYLGWIKQHYFLTLLAIHLLTIAFTVTPGIGGVLFAAAIWFAVVLLEGNKSFAARTVAGFGVAAAFLFTLVSAFSLKMISTSPYYFNIYGHRIDPTQRLLTWQGAIETFLADPLTGNGLGLATANVQFVTLAGYPQLLTDAHNVFLSVAGQSGLPALVILCVLTVWIVKRTYPWKVDRSDAGSVVRIALGIAFVSAFIVQGFVGSFENARHLWIAAGMIAAFPVVIKRQI